MATSSSNGESPDDAVEISSLLSLLPACDRCRSQKKRCDTRLPACANCTRSGTECAFHDHVLNERISREHIDGLLQLLNQLQSSPSREVSDASPLPCPDPTFHFVRVRDAFRFSGPRAQVGVQVPPSIVSTSLQSIPTYPPLESSMQLVIGLQMHQFLVNKYMTVVHPAYPILEGFLLDVRPADRDMSPWVRFTLYMVYAIGCHCLPKNDNRFAPLSESCYRAAQPHFESVMAELDVKALQAVLLLAVHCLFDPREGNIGQLIAFAYRLEIEMVERDGDETGNVLSRLRKIIFCLGNLVASTLDRPVGFHIFDSDEPISFDMEIEGNFLYSLYAAQAAARQSRTCDMPSRSELESIRCSPLTLAAAHETIFLLQTNAASALALLAVYTSADNVLNVFTSHWAFKATVILMSSMSAQERQTGYVQGLQVLERCALKWPNAEALRSMIGESWIPDP